MKGNLDKYRTSGPEAAMEDFQEHMKTFIPQLDQLAASSNIVIQLQDHIQVRDSSSVISTWDGKSLLWLGSNNEYAKIKI